MRLPSVRGWLELCSAAVTRLAKAAPLKTNPVVQVDADLADLIPQYMDNGWADLRFARQLLAKNDFFMLARMAHRIRASATNYGFAALGAIAEALEAAAEAQDGSAVAAQLDILENFLRTVRIEYV